MLLFGFNLLQEISFKEEFNLVTGILPISLHLLSDQIPGTTENNKHPADKGNIDQRS